MNLNWQLFLVLPVFITICDAYKVLLLTPINGKSHFLYMSSFVQTLLGRGHEVTFLTSNSLSHLKLANYTEVLIDPPYDWQSMMKQEDLIERSSGSAFAGMLFLPTFMKVLNEHAFQSANVQKFIKSTGQHFDIIVGEEFYSDAFLMFAHKHKAPVVTICPFGVPEFIDYQHGLLTPSSIVPHSLLPYTDNMSFTQRWYSSIHVMFEWLVRNYLYLPSEDGLARKYFADFAPLPPLTDIVQNISVTLVNTHRAISPPRPSMPSVIPIGGAHVKPAKPLPNDLKTFLDGAKDGAIYFSLGSNLQSAQLPTKLINIFLDTFKNLKQRVLWKFEDESRTDLPPNVMVRKWMPQNDILAHPNVVLFISHGGMFGTTESLHFGVPMLLIPFFGDQYRNAHRITLAGYGKFLNHREITHESFSETLEELLENKSFLKNAKQTSEVFRDNVVHPMDEAMFWIEHVAKFKGANHLKSHARSMSWFTYLLLDVFLVNVLGAFVVILAFRFVIKKLFCNKKTGTNSEKKKN